MAKICNLELPTRRTWLDSIHRNPCSCLKSVLKPGCGPNMVLFPIWDLAPKRSFKVNDAD